MKHFRTKFFISTLAAILLSPVFLIGQATPDEHSGHHPPTVETTTSPVQTPPPDGKTANANTGGMTGGMGEMMNGMGKPTGKELYPSLMQLPDLPPEKRAEAARLADERAKEGQMLLSSGLEKLNAATANQDSVAMQEASVQIRQGQTLLESGLAAQRALVENQKPQDTAFKWFKSEMNLAPAAPVENPHGFFGLSWFHYISMLTLAAFSAAMIWMYFHKMKRADALVARLSGNSAATLPAAVPKPAPNPNAEQVPVNSDIAPSKPNSWSGTLLVAKIFQETPAVKTFRLVDPSGGKLPFNYLPGQFITVTVAPKGVPVKRSYTIASSPTHRDYCEITVKREPQGIVSDYLDDLVHGGELLQMTGPSGKFTFTGEESDGVVLIAGGVGVTPMMSVIRFLTDRSWAGEIFLIYGCKTDADVIFREELEYLQKRYPNLHVTLVADSADSSTWKYQTGRITKEIIAGSVPEIASRRVHICGPTPMMDAVKLLLAELKVPVENIKSEVFAGQPKPKTPSPASGETATDGAAPALAGTAGTAVATFARSNKTAVLPPDKSVLEASEDVGVNIDYSCRVGTCGICKTKLLSGKVTMEVEDALTEEDKTNNIILACQAKATGDVSVDA